MPILGPKEEEKLRKEKENILKSGILAAVRKGDRDEVKALISAKADIETRDEVLLFTDRKVASIFSFHDDLFQRQWTALHLAAVYKQAKIMGDLIAADADPEACDKVHLSVLHIISSRSRFQGT